MGHLSCMAVHNFFLLGGGGGGDKVISESGEHGCPAALHCRRVWGHAPPGKFGNFRCCEVHSGAF